MTFTKFTHILLKQHQASRRSRMECVEHEKGELSDHLFENFTFFRKRLQFCDKLCELKQV